jgi:hypothetical protein
VVVAEVRVVGIRDGVDRAVLVVEQHLVKVRIRVRVKIRVRVRGRVRVRVRVQVRVRVRVRVSAVVEQHERDEHGAGDEEQQAEETVGDLGSSERV